MRALTYILTLFLASSFVLLNYQPFEGTISFQLKYSDIDERLPNDYLCSSSGDSMIYYQAKDGYFKKFYCHDDLIQRRWFNSQDNALHMINESDDTLYFYFASETDYNSKVERSNIIENILGHPCRKFTVTLESKEEKNLPTVVYDYYITTDLKIDSEPFKNYKEGGYSEIISETPGLILKQIYYGPYYTRTQEAVSLEQMDIKLDQHKPTRKLIKKRI